MIATSWSILGTSAGGDGVEYTGLDHRYRDDSFRSKLRLAVSMERAPFWEVDLDTEWGNSRIVHAEGLACASYFSHSRRGLQRSLDIYILDFL